MQYLPYIIYAIGLILMSIDYLQTSYAGKVPERFKETNPILGSYPSKRKIDFYFSILAIFYTLVTIFLVDWYQFIPPFTACFIHGRAIMVNRGNGVRIINKFI